MLNPLLVVVMFSILPSTLMADVFKCKVNGKTIYSQIPCSKSKAQVADAQFSKKAKDQGKKEVLAARKNIRLQEANNSLYVEAIDERVDLNNDISSLKSLIDEEFQVIELERKNINIYKAEEPDKSIAYLDASNASKKQKKTHLFYKKIKGQIKKSKKIIKKSKKLIRRLKKQVKRKERQLKKLNIRIEKLVSKPRSD
ncbi:MAG: hypothetical protein V3U78_06370 [Thiotrichaceae bacterium]